MIKLGLWIVVMASILLVLSGDAVADGDDDEGHHMMDDNWWGFPFFGGGFMMMGLWLVFLFIGALVYMDAQDRGMNGFLWFILVIIPWVGILFLIMYLITREENTQSRNRRAKHMGRPRVSALALLNRRYARGEITREEYLRIRNDIRDKS
jgi:putative membrane protein